MPDAATIPPMISSGQHTKIPAGIYTISSTTPSDYPHVLGPCGLILSGLSDFSIDARGVTLVQEDCANNANMLMIERCSRFRVDGLTLQPNPTGLPAGADPASLLLLDLLDFEFSNLSVCGARQIGTGVTGEWLVRGRFDRVVLQSVNEGFDLAFIRQVRFRDCIGNGLNYSGSGAAEYGFINIEYDAVFASAYPALAQWLVSDDVVIDGCRAWNFSAGACVKAGSGYRIVNNDFSWNPSGCANWGQGQGAGVYLLSETAATAPSTADPVQNVAISGNCFVANGMASGSAVAGAGVIVDASAVGAAQIYGVRMGGNLYNGNPSKLIQQGNVTAIVSD